MIEVNKLFNQAYIEIKKLWAKYYVLSNFTNLPKNLNLKNLKTNKLPVTDKILNFSSNMNSDT